LTIPTEHVDAMGAVVDAKKNSPLCRERHRRNVLHPPQEFSNHQFWKQMVGRLCSSVANHLNLTKNAGSTRRSEKGGQPSASAGRWQTRCFITGPTKPSSLPARSKPPATRPITPFNTCSICPPPEISRDAFSDWLRWKRALLHGRQSTPSGHESDPQLRGRRWRLSCSNRRRNTATPRRTGRPGWRTLGAHLESSLGALRAMSRS